MGFPKGATPFGRRRQFDSWATSKLLCSNGGEQSLSLTASPPTLSRIPLHHYTTDILVVGAGPAGATLARTTPDRFSVILLDKRRLEQPVPFPDKPCGGLLAPDAQACLFRMGLGLPEHLLCRPQIFGVRAMDLQSGRESLYQRYYVNIRREELDRWLFSLAASRPNVTPLTGRRLVGLVQDAEEARAVLDDGSVIRARLVVGADGAGSRVRRSLLHGQMRIGGQEQADASAMPYGDEESVAGQAPTSPPGAGKEPSRSSGATGLLPAFFAPRTSFAVQYWFRADAPAEFGVFFHSQVSDFYSWTIPKDGHLLVGSILPPARQPGPSPRARMDMLLEHLRRKGYCGKNGFAEPVRTESCSLACPGLGAPFALGEGRIVLVGEAAGLISPSSAEGISYALHSATSLAKAVETAGLGIPASTSARDGAPPAPPDLDLLGLYRQSLRRMTLRLRCKWAKAAVIYTPLLRNAAMASGLGSMGKFP